MTSARLHEQVVAYLKGGLQNPLSSIGQRAKFFDCVEHSLDAATATATALFNSLQRFSSLKSLAGVTRYFRRG